MTDSVIRCSCGSEIGKYKDIVEKYINENKPLEELFDKFELNLCCRKDLTVLTTLKHYYHFSGYKNPKATK